MQCQPKIYKTTKKRRVKKTVETRMPELIDQHSQNKFSAQNFFFLHSKRHIRDCTGSGSHNVLEMWQLNQYSYKLIEYRKSSTLLPMRVIYHPPWHALKLNFIPAGMKLVLHSILYLRLNYSVHFFTLFIKNLMNVLSDIAEQKFLNSFILLSHTMYSCNTI